MHVAERCTANYFDVAARENHLDGLVGRCFPNRPFLRKTVALYENSDAAAQIGAKCKVAPMS